ncbi:MAG: hypothetical protein QXG01_06770 [Candidatus Bathyarchaeia archaeon]
MALKGLKKFLPYATPLLIGFILTLISAIRKITLMPRELYRYGYPAPWLERHFINWPLKPSYRVIFDNAFFDLTFWVLLSFLVVKIFESLRIKKIFENPLNRIQIFLFLNLLTFTILDIKIPNWLIETIKAPQIHTYHLWVLRWTYYSTVFLISASSLNLIHFGIGIATGFLFLEFGTLDILHFLIQGKALPKRWDWFSLHELFGIELNIVYSDFQIIFLSIASIAIAVGLNLLYTWYQAKA